MNKTVLERINLAKKNKLTALNLKSCGLEFIPDEIFELTDLAELNLSNNQLKNVKLLEPLQEIKSLTKIILENNQISDISPLKNLERLNYLDLSANYITDIAPLSALKNLTMLIGATNSIEDITPLQNLTQLSILHLPNNKISDIESLKDLSNLTSVYFSNNKIKNIRPIKNLTNLTSIFLSENQISDLRGIELLINLRVLYVRQNRITDIRPLAKLVKLVTLYLSGNQITDISPLQELINITELDLGQNMITDVRPLLKLASTQTSFSWEYKANSITLEDNPLTNPPPEIVKQGNEAVLRYFKEAKKGTYILNEARVLIVGQGGAGKTSLRRKLKDKKSTLPAPADTTRGIEVDTLSVRNNNKNYALHLWDFGGQNIQHYAHQFFLSGSSLYILLNNEREQNPNFQYWLNIIEMLGGKSPVIIVQNEIAGHCEGIKNLAAIRSRFENVLSPVHSVNILNAEHDPRFSVLKNDIIHHAINLPHIGKKYPSSYIKVRDRLQKESNELKHFVTWLQYKEICKTEKVSDEALMKDIATTFSILGICLYFKDDIELKNYLFLNPKWIIDALFRLLYDDIIIKQQGEFSENDVVQIWHEPEYEGMHSKLLRMMENLELCYRIKDTSNYIVPQRLPVAEDSYNWNEEEVTRVEYQYKFMPKGIITRITCRLHEKIMRDNVWNDAVVFQLKQSKAFVREVYSENKISIEISGNKREELLNRLLDEIDDIHKKSQYENLQVQKLIPCCCEQCTASENPYFFDYDYLCRLLEDREFQERCAKSRKMMDIRVVLQMTGIEYEKDLRIKDPTGERESITQHRPIKVFVSYSHKDEKLKNQLDDHLSDLKYSNSIAVWHDRKIGGGNDWDEMIKKELREADIILLLISASFMASKYIWETEVKLAFERHNKGKAKVIPVFLRKCEFGDMPFAKLQGYPKDAKPIASSRDKDAAFTQVAQGIKNDIKNWKPNNS